MRKEKGFQFFHREVKGATDKFMNTALGMVAENIVTRAIMSMKQTKVTKRMGKETFVSAEGHPPSVQTGILAGEITKKRQGKNWLVGAVTEYAPWLEYGTSKMAPRPFMRPAMDYTFKRLGKVLKRIPKV